MEESSSSSATEQVKVLVVALSCHTTDQAEAASCVEVLSRILVGLALDGLSCHLSVNTYEPEDESEYDYEEEGEGEFDG